MMDPTIEIKKMWRIIAIGPDSVLELRALGPKGVQRDKPPKLVHFQSKDFPSVEACKEACEKTALALNDGGYNVYVVMNPIRADFADSHAVKDGDIRYRDLLLIDIDRVGDTSCPAADVELDAAKALADEIKSYLSEQQWPKPVTVMSGNGYHLYYVLGEVPNDGESTKLIRMTLQTLAKKFNNEIVGIDTTVYNAARITKVPGTIMRKGEETDERPYRRAYVCDE